jgi:2-phosphosulfolactate phosphatase
MMVDHECRQRVIAISTVAALRPAVVAGRTVVVFDVLRATTVMATALENGAVAVIPCLTPEAARELAAARPAGSALLAGERQSLPIPGFDLGNSPESFTRELVAGKTVIMTTTNGTRALQAAQGAQRLFAGCLRNAPAVARRLSGEPEIVLVCAGTEDEFDLSDALGVGAVIAALQESGEVEADDLSQALAILFRASQVHLLKSVAASRHGRRLADLGLADDLRFCMEYGVSPMVPEWRDGVLIPMPVGTRA